MAKFYYVKCKALAEVECVVEIVAPDEDRAVELAHRRMYIDKQEWNIAQLLDGKTVSVSETDETKQAHTAKVRSPWIV